MVLAVLLESSLSSLSESMVRTRRGLPPQSPTAELLIVFLAQDQTRFIHGSEARVPISQDLLAPTSS
uniref:Uncharacterized protein n=1 Tax=Cannabis sativa TaxID=3483 RepID=A0A803PQZ4_CANSA